MPGSEKAETAEFSERRSRALRLLEAGGSALVALSGGVDSAALLVLAIEALGPGRVLAVTGNSASLAPSDLEAARSVASALGARHEVVDTRELEDADYRANRGDRCLHCRNELFRLLRELAARDGLDQVVYGALRADLGDVRPGMRAAEQLGVGAPLLEAGLTKGQVRRVAAEAGLAVRDKPSGACLASRIPVGTTVTAENLGQVAAAEAALAAMGFRQFRVRHHGEIARLELDAGGADRLRDPEIRARVAGAVKKAGFRFVAVDLEGYRTGSLNPGG